MRFVIAVYNLKTKINCKRNHRQHRAETYVIDLRHHTEPEIVLKYWNLNKNNLSLDMTYISLTLTLESRFSS